MALFHRRCIVLKAYEIDENGAYLLSKSAQLCQPMSPIH